jgi:hypothetical protein
LWREHGGAIDHARLGTFDVNLHEDDSLKAEVARQFVQGLDIDALQTVGLHACMCELAYTHSLGEALVGLAACRGECGGD